MRVPGPVLAPEMYGCVDASTQRPFDRLLGLPHAPHTVGAVPCRMTAVAQVEGECSREQDGVGCDGCMVL